MSMLMLRHYVESDMRDVVRDLKDSGYDFQFEWLNPFWNSAEGQ